MKRIVILISFSLLTIFNLYAQKTLNEAEQLILGGHYLEVVDILQQYCSDNPDNQEAHYFLGEAFNKLSCSDGSDLNNANLYYAFKATEEFKKVIKISPYYSGKIFTQGPYSKITSIWGTMAVTFAFKQDLDSATWAFNHGKQENGFYDAILEYNRNVLATCAPNSILFTNGDGDTFPAWYLQLVENYRRDITVINLSLLNVAWYIKLQRKNIFSDTAVEFDLADEEIDELKPIRWKSQEIILPVPSKELNSENQMKYYDVSEIDIIEEGQMKFIMPNTLTIEDITAIRVQDIIVKEIIESNQWERPVYFAVTCSEDSKIGLLDYLRKDGLAYKLVPQRGAEGEEFINEIVLSTNLKKYTYDFYKNEAYKYHDLLLMAQNYYNPFLWLAVYYEDKGEYQNVIQTLDYLNEKIPFNTVNMKNGFLFEVAILYFNSGEIDKFNEISTTVERNATKDMELNPEDVSSFYNPYRILIEVYEKKEDYENIILIWQKIEVMYPNDSVVKSNIEKYKLLLLNSK